MAYDLVQDFGAILNDTSAGARTTNKNAILAAFANPGNYKLPHGKLYLPANAQIVIPQACGIWGCGMWENQSAIYGDGNIFILDNSTGGDSRTPLKDLLIANESSRGKLVHANLTTGLGKTVFENVNFKKAQHHLYQEGGYAVSWEMNGCYFEDASGDSIYLSVFTTFVERGCWHIMNGRHLHIGDGSVNNNWSASFASYDGVYENAQRHAIVIMASGADLWAVNFFNPYFETNGLLNGDPDVFLQTVGSNKIYCVNFFGGDFDAAYSGQTNRIDWYEPTANTIGKITLNGTMSFSNKSLAPNSSKIYNNNMTFVGAGPQSSWKTAQYA